MRTTRIQHTIATEHYFFRQFFFRFQMLVFHLGFSISSSNENYIYIFKSIMCFYVWIPIKRSKNQLNAKVCQTVPIRFVFRWTIELRLSGSHIFISFHYIFMVAHRHRREIARIPPNQGSSYLFRYPKCLVYSRIGRIK